MTDNPETLICPICHLPYWGSDCHHGQTDLLIHAESITDLIAAIEKVMTYAVDWSVPTIVWDNATTAIRKAKGDNQ